MNAVKAEEIETILLRLVSERGPGRSVDPAEVAKTLAPEGDSWRALLKPVRAAAVRLASEGRISILRKGKPVDPSDFRGVYRLAPPM